MTSVQEIFKECEHWMRLGICINIHIKEALINIVHNNIKDPRVTPIPSDPVKLYAFLQANKKKIQKSPSHQQSILLPTNSQSVDSSTFDISITRYLIQSFCGIVNARGDWKEPDKNDRTLFAFVYRAARLRNCFAHDNNIKGLNATEFETKWKELEDILQGLKYNVNLEPFKNDPINLVEYEQHVLLEDFVDHLRSYKEECTKEKFQDDYILRRFSDGGNKGNIVTESDLESLIKDNDRLNIYGKAGLGKTSTARRLKNEWSNKKILNGHHLIYYDSKKMGKLVKVKSFAAPLYFSEMWDYLRKKGRTEDNLSIYKCVKTTIDDLVIIIDGIDEFSIRELVNGNYSIDKLELKIRDNEKITAAETISAIYFGFVFPFSKVVLLGRTDEFDHLKNVNDVKNAGIFNRRNIDLELLEFDDTNIKDFTRLKICKLPNQKFFTDSCQGIYEKIENIDLCKIPAYLNSLVELYIEHPNINIGRIIQTKLIIATLLNRLTKRIYQKSYLTLKSFREISEQKDFSNYSECICKLGEISFNTLLYDNITVKVEENREHFIYKEEIEVEREIIEELDLFYVRDLEYYLILEPQLTLNMEFLSACYLFSHPKRLLKLNFDRQLVIISFIAGLHADDYFTKDFVKNVLNTPSYSLDQFFRWLFNVEDVRESLPDGGDGYNCWFGLMETQKLSPSFFLLDYISHEVEIPQTYIPTTIVCYCGRSFEWYRMKYLKHNFLSKLSDKLNIELFLKKFPQYDFIIKGYIYIENNDKFNLLNKCGNNNRITFRINTLEINTSLNTSFSCNFNINALYIGDKCDSRTIDMILNALSPPTTNTSSSNSQPAINCKRFLIAFVSDFNLKQTEKLLELGLSGVVDCISLRFDFFTDGQLTILKNAERKTNKMLNIEFNKLKAFNQMFGLSNLANRHVSLNLYNVNVKVKDNDLIKLREHIPSGYANNLTNFDNYKIINYEVPFVRKENSSQDCKQSMFLNLYDADFSEVSADVFAGTFSLIPSLSCVDSKRYDGSEPIPSSHWLKLSQINNCRLNEMRVWRPRAENFKHFLNIKTSLLQLVFESKDELKGLLNHIVTTTNIHLRKQIKVFVVKHDKYDWETIEEYEINYFSDDLRLDDISVPFHEGELHLNWCCEISLPIQENIHSVTIVSASDDEPLKKKRDSP